LGCDKTSVGLTVEKERNQCCWLFILSFQLVVTPGVRRTLNKLKEVSPNNNKAEEEKKQGEKIDAKKEDISLSLK